MVIYGSAMGPSRIAQAAFPLPGELSGTAVKISTGGQTFTCPIVYTLATQVAALLPSRVPAGAAALTVEYQGQTSAPLEVRVVAAAVGIFTLNQAGYGAGIVTNAANELFTFTRPARPGEVGIVWGTGLGSVAGDDAAGPLPGDLSDSDAEVLVAGRPVAIRYRGRSGCCAGLDQIVFEVPSGIEGCLVPVTVRAAGIAGNTVSMPIAHSGGCGAAGGFTAAATQSLASSTAVSLGRGSIYRETTIDSANRTSNTDHGFVSFAIYPSLYAAMAGASALPPAGSCTVFPINGQFEVPQHPVQPMYLDAGSQIIATAQSSVGSLQMNINRAAKGIFIGLDRNVGPPEEFGRLIAGTIASRNGGSDVSAFSVSPNYEGSPLLDFSLSSTAINRDEPLNVTWRGGGVSLVSITGYSQADRSPNGAGFLCVARGSAGQFSVPSYVLRALPASAANAASITVATEPTPYSGFVAGVEAFQFSIGNRIKRDVTFR